MDVLKSDTTPAFLRNYAALSASTTTVRDPYDLPATLLSQPSIFAGEAPRIFSEDVGAQLTASLQVWTSGGLGPEIWSMLYRLGEGNATETHIEVHKVLKRNLRILAQPYKMVSIVSLQPYRPLCDNFYSCIVYYLEQMMVHLKSTGWGMKPINVRCQGTPGYRPATVA